MDELLVAVGIARGFKASIKMNDDVTGFIATFSNEATARKFVGSTMRLTKLIKSIDKNVVDVSIKPEGFLSFP